MSLIRAGIGKIFVLLVRRYACAIGSVAALLGKKDYTRIYLTI